MALVWAMVQLRDCLENADLYTCLHVEQGSVAIARYATRLRSYLSFLTMPSIAIVLGSLLLAVLFPLALTATYTYSQERHRKTFRFMDLPPELRSEVFEYLLEPADLDLYKNKTVAVRSRTLAQELGGRCSDLKEWIIAQGESFTRRLPWHTEHWLPTHSDRCARKRPTGPTYRHLNSLCLVSKQFGAEFLSVYLKNVQPTFVIDASQARSTEPAFRIRKEHLQNLRYCRLKVLATPGIVDAFDPRQAEADDWLVRHSVFASMKQMTKLRSMTLVIEASGNQLWNPLWLWHFTSRAFKSSDIKAFDRIDFTMNEPSWALKEPNHLRRRDGGEGWEWICTEGHNVAEDGEREQTIRGFCSILYGCKICAAAAGDDDGDDGF